MGQIKVTDEWLYQYMPVVDDAMIGELEDHTDYEYRFTGKFERRMRALVRREAHPWAEAFYRLSKRAAVLLLGAVAVLLVMTMSVQARRVRFFETVTTMLEDSMRYSYVMDQKPETMQYVEPGYIPEGYWEVERDVAEDWFSVMYMNENGNMFIWDQMMIEDGDELIADIEYEQQIIKEISGKSIVISLYGDGFVSVYCEYGAYIYLLTADNLSVDEVCKMFKTIKDD